MLGVWATHPRRVVVDGATDFLEKARRALTALEDAIAQNDDV